MSDSFPQNTVAERAVLGAMLRDPTSFLRVSGSGLTAEHFWSPHHGALFALMLEMHADGIDPDSITVPERVVRSGRVDAYGGIAYVLTIGDDLPSTANIGHYCDIVIAHARRRAILEAIDLAREEAIDAKRPADDVVDHLVAAVLAVMDSRVSGGFKPMWQGVDDVVEATRQAVAQPATHGGASTGFRDLDDLVGRMAPGHMWVLAARPRMGKTALALDIMAAVAMPLRDADAPTRKVAMFSLEMSREDLALRRLAARSGIAASSLRSGRCGNDGLVRVDAVAASVSHELQAIYVDDSRGLSINQLRARAHGLARQIGQLSLIVVDYLQLVRGELGPRVSREQEVSHVSAELRRLGADLGCPVLVLAQLNRQCESRGDFRPILSDIRESGGVEADADLVMFLHRMEVYKPDDASWRGIAEAIIAKNRHGPTGTIELLFDAQATRFSSVPLSQIARRGGRP